MEIIHLSEKNVTECAKRAAEVLRAGGVVLYPTDTLYGLGADALSDAAVDKIYTIKWREEEKPIHCIVADLTMAAEYAELDPNARVLAKQFLPGPLTLILKKRSEITTGIARNIETIGIRIPKNDFCLKMIKQFGGPITTTSANKSGESPERTTKKIIEQLDAHETDLVIDAGELPVSKPSSVVDLSSTHPIILREGAISAAEIWETLRAES